MSRFRSPSWSAPLAAGVAAGLAFIVGLSGTAAAGVLLVDGREDRIDFLLVGVGAVGAGCALIGAGGRARLRALLAGGVGSAVGIALASGWWAWPSWLIFLWVIFGAPYLAGFAAAIVLTEAFRWGMHHSRVVAVLVAAVIVGSIGAGTAFVGPRLIEGPCMGTSIAQAAASFSYYIQLDSGPSGRRAILDYQLKLAGQDATKVGAAYYGAAYYDDDYTAVLKKRLCFPSTVRAQVNTLAAAVEARAQVQQLLARDPFNPDLLAKLSSSQAPVISASAELSRMLGLPPRSEPSPTPGS